MNAFLEIKRQWRKHVEKYFRNPVFYARILKELARKEFGEARVYLFGSVARGEALPGVSDIDLLVVTPKAPEKITQKGLFIDRFHRKIGDLFTPFEIHIVTPEEFENWYSKFIKKEDLLEV
ncbi:MAG: hypothetical protein DSZ24_00635 [Thermodesulfatator sp.]|nr:MAG: hypothetical protein DSZ24_00635 [Thermodesulfatator sp.]